MLIPFSAMSSCTNCHYSLDEYLSMHNVDRDRLVSYYGDKSGNAVIDSPYGGGVTAVIDKCEYYTIPLSELKIKIHFPFQPNEPRVLYLKTGEVYNKSCPLGTDYETWPPGTQFAQ
jgi:hypothetical protein